MSAFQPAVVAVRVGVETDILAQVLGIQSPALGVRGVVVMLPELRHVGQLLRDGDLQVMPW